MLLKELIAAAGNARPLSKKLPEEVTGLAYDSRNVSPGDLFFAVPGTERDGRFYIPRAVERGAVAVVGRDLDEHVLFGAGFIEVPDVRDAMARMSIVFHDDPSSRLGLVGITGTNGKTTTAYLVRAALAAGGGRTGLLGTIEYDLGGGEVLEAGRTTPESADLQRHLAAMVRHGLDFGVMEVSSHALAMKRVHGTRFRAAVFTNLTRDHLDFHPTMEDYFLAKREIFDHLHEGGFGVVNLDDEHGQRIFSMNHGKIISFGLGRKAEIRAEAIEADRKFLHFRLGYNGRSYPVKTPLIGHHNVLNILAAFGVGVGLGLPAEAVITGIEGVEKIPGRFERVDEGQDFLMLVDYAHTDDALERALLSARALSGGRLTVVFGCGGDRDRGKRPKMGHVASQHADRVFLTNDNPRSENPEKIIREIEEGMAPAGNAGKKSEKDSGREVEKIVQPDRRKAIRQAVRTAETGDIVLIAGKGHETYQEVHSVRTHFSDAEEAVAAIREFFPLPSTWSYRGRR